MTVAVSPALALSLTLAAYAGSVAVWRRGGRHPLLNPTLMGILLVATFLTAFDYDLAAYRHGASSISLLLGPAVVALAVPIYRHAPVLRARAGVLATALISGSSAVVLTTIFLAAWFGATMATLLSLAPKSATAAVSMAISERAGGIPALTAVVTVLAGITGAVAGPSLLTILGIRDPIARGFGIGIASHGIGTARAFQESEAAGMAAGLAMGLNAILTALIVPPLVALADIGGP